MSNFMRLLDWLTLDQSIEYVAQAGIAGDVELLVRAYAITGGIFMLDSNTEEIYVPRIEHEDDKRMSWPNMIYGESVRDGFKIDCAPYDAWLGDIMLSRPLATDGWLDNKVEAYGLPIMVPDEQVCVPVYRLPKTLFADCLDSDEAEVNGIKRPDLPTTYSSRFLWATWRTLIAEGGVKLQRKTIDTVIAKAAQRPELPAQPLGQADRIPPRTAATIYAEYKAMAEAIARLSNRKASTMGELAAVVMDECAKAGSPMPVEQRTVTARLEKA